jgi:maleate isomerase
MAPDGVAIHATRVYFGSMDADPNLSEPIELAALRSYLRPPLHDAAASLLAGGPVSVIAYAFTTTSYLGGDGDDDILRTRLQRRTNGVPVVTTCAAAVQALRALGIARVALFHPPWISDELNSLGAAYFGRLEVDVVSASPVDLSGGQHGIEPDAIYEWTRSRVPDNAEAVFFGGNGFRVIATIARLEQDLGRPVLSANQVLLWAALKAAGVNDANVTGYGQLFTLETA